MRFALPFNWPQFREGKPSIKFLILPGLLLFIIFFLFGFFISFPDSVLHDRVVSEVNLQLPAGNSFAAKAIQLKFPLRLQIDQAHLELDISQLPRFDLSTVSLRPTFSTLLGQPGLNIHAESEFGILDGILSRSGQVDLHLRDGKFELALPDLPQLKIGGVITAVDLVGQLQSDKKEQIRLHVGLDELFLSGAEKFGLGQSSLPLGQLALELSGTGRSLAIEHLSLSGGVVAVTGAGKLVMQQPIDSSRLDLRLSVRPGTSADSGLRTLLELLGPLNKNGDHSVHLRGRLFAPQFK
jgi:type II secretion system protein N